MTVMSKGLLLNSKHIKMSREEGGFQGLCIKVGRGHRDGCVGTCDLGTRDEGLEDIKYGTRGCVGRGRGDVK